MKLWSKVKSYLFGPPRYKVLAVYVKDGWWVDPEYFWIISPIDYRVEGDRVFLPKKYKGMEVKIVYRLGWGATQYKIVVAK